MPRKIALDAFEVYVAMGEGRSYRLLAERYGVTKRAVTKLAARERWSERLEEIQRKARERADDRLVDRIDEMQARHLKTLKAVNARVLAALKQYPLASGMEAVRAADLLIKLERSILAPEGAEQEREKADHVQPSEAHAELAALIERQRQARAQERAAHTEAQPAPAEGQREECDGGGRRLVLVRRASDA